MARIVPSSSAKAPNLSVDPDATDPSLLKDNSEFKTFQTSRFTYRDVRVFYRPHPKTAELPSSPGPLPLLVCVPGLGGSAAQFHPLLSSLVDLAPSLAIDWPGGGRSKYELSSWEAYSTAALSELLEVIIESYRDKENGQTVVLIGHSMGTILSAWLANKTVKHHTWLADHVVGLVAICPLSGPMKEDHALWAKRFFYVPGFVLALWRAYDGMGATESPSVRRFVGASAEPELKLLQYRFNQQSRTNVWRRMAYGAIPTYQDGKPVGGVPSVDVWAGLDIPVYLIAGENDELTPPREAEKIAAAMGAATKAPSGETGEDNADVSVDAAAPVNSSLNPKDHAQRGIGDITDSDFQSSKTALNGASDDPHEDPSTPPESPAMVPEQPRHPAKVVQKITMPVPATHALLYSPRSVRVLAGLISDFLAAKITGRLSLGWQLQYLSREGKWDVKNLSKWKSVTPVSDLIVDRDGKPIFRAMKTLREADDVHCPKEFTARWGDVIRDVIDISKDQPVYDPRGLERAGVHYHKMPTVSKIPPLPHEVEAFIHRVDAIRSGRHDRAQREGWAGEPEEESVIGVHCHYGFNRTGYFVVCYLVERCGFGVQEAVDVFAKARPNGIRHSHFLDRLYVRYNLEAPALGTTT